MHDTACVVHEYDQTQHIIISRVCGRVGPSDALRIATTAARLAQEHETIGIIYDYTGALICVEASDIPILLRRSLRIHESRPSAIVDPHSYALVLRYSDMSRRAGRHVVAAMTIAEARSYIDYVAFGKPGIRTRQINHLVRAAAYLSPARLSGLIDAVQILSSSSGRESDRGQ